MKNADFQKLLENQSPEELACWFLVTKVRHMNGLVEPKRVRQMHIDGRKVGRGKAWWMALPGKEFPAFEGETMAIETEEM